MRKGSISSGLLEAPLLERERELELLGALLDHAGDGRGRLCAIEGPAGIGKSRLLLAARGAAAERGTDVLLARGGSLEHDFPFGIVRQLFEGVLRRARGSERKSLMAGAAELAGPVIGLERAGEMADLDEDRSFGVLHGLYWLTSNLAERGPLLLAVDDAHWADAPSLRFLDYLTRRIGELPVLLLLALRPAEQSADDELLRRLAAHSDAAVIHPAALSEPAAAELVAAMLAGHPEAEFCRACHKASAGNPFLLGELIAALRAERVTPTAQQASHVGRMAPVAITRSVLLRLASLPPMSGRLARAVAVLGAGAELRDVAALAELPERAAADAVDALVRADILARERPLEFVHPVNREAVYAELAPGERAREHARAARILADRGAPPDRVAIQLLASEPAGLHSTVATLRHVATAALARGAPSAAVTYLRRALAEPPPRSALAGVIHELGRAEVLVGDPAGIEHLEQAWRLSEAGRPRAEIAHALALALIPRGRIEEALAVLDTALAELADADHELALQLEADAMYVARMHTHQRASASELRGGYREPGRAASPGERLVLANLAFEEWLEGGTAEEAVGLAKAALADGLVAGADRPSLYAALWPLLAADEFDLVERFCQAALEDARARGSVTGFATASSFRAELGYRRGTLVEAESDVRTALEATRLGDSTLAATSLTHLFTGAAAEILVERDQTQTAFELLGAIRDSDPPAGALGDFALFGRALLRIDIGEPERALQDLRRLCAEEQHRPSPRRLPHRSLAALVLATLGQQDEARRLAGEELAAARAWGGQRAIGVALRAQGLVESSVELLEQAVAALDRSGAALEHARALTDLGSALRRAGHRKDARESLRDGLELAHRCGAITLERRALQELRASGARPRSPVRTGRDTLTPSEQRIATMAADGMSNRDIAQALFLSLKTVEMHLAHTYLKLGIHSRRELSGALDTP